MLLKEYWKASKPKRSGSQAGDQQTTISADTQRYRLEGVTGLVSRKRGVPSNRKMEAAIREIVDNFINDPLVKSFGPTLMAEKVEQMKAIRLSKETLRKMMIEAGVWKSKVKKKVEPHYARPRRKHRGRCRSTVLNMPGWKIAHQKPLCWCLWMMPPAISQLAEFVPEKLL